MRFMKNVILIFISFISFFLISCTYISINNSYLYTYDDSGYAASETVDVNGKLIRNFDVDWPVGKVIVRSYDGEYIVIHESVSEVEDQYLMHTKVVDDSFFIRYLASGSNFKDIEEKTLTINVPCTLDSLIINVVSANIEVYDLEISSSKLSSVSGKVEVSNLKTNELKIGTVSGQSEINNSEIKNCVVDDVSGGLNITESNITSLKYVGVSSSLKAVLKLLPNSVDIETTSGSVILILPQDSIINVDFDTTSGNIENEFGDDNKSNNIIDITTVSGDITIKNG